MGAWLTGKLLYIGWLCQYWYNGVYELNICAMILVVSNKYQKYQLNINICIGISSQYLQPISRYRQNYWLGTLVRLWYWLIIWNIYLFYMWIVLLLGNMYITCKVNRQITVKPTITPIWINKHCNRWQYFMIFVGLILRTFWYSMCTWQKQTNSFCI